MNIIIGRNGVGKTSFLGAFAKSLVDSASQIGQFDRLPLAQCVIAISYSAFDNFEIPYDFESEHINYFYCGLRGNNALLFSCHVGENDISLLNSGCLPNSLSAFTTQYLGEAVTVKKSDKDNTWYVFDEYNKCILEFVGDNTIYCYGEKILAFKEQYMTLENNLNKILSNCDSEKRDFVLSLLGIILPIDEQAKSFLYHEEHRRILYNNMSAGQRIISGMIVAVCANIKENSILLIDEPETHLHPGLLSSFMAIIEKILEAFSSYAIIATHSPLILQQVPSSAVTIFERYKNTVSWRKPDFECFGENQQTISEMALDLAEPELDFHDKLRDLLEQKNIQEVNALFDNKLGFSARLYMESIIQQKLGAKR